MLVSSDGTHSIFEKRSRRHSILMEANHVEIGALDRRPRRSRNDGSCMRYARCDSRKLHPSHYSDRHAALSRAAVCQFRLSVLQWKVDVCQMVRPLELLHGMAMHLDRSLRRNVHSALPLLLPAHAWLFTSSAQTPRPRLPQDR